MKEVCMGIGEERILPKSVQLVVKGDYARQEREILPSYITTFQK